MRSASPDLLDFLQGPLLSHQTRMMGLIMDWQASISRRFPLDLDELAYLMKLTELAGDLCANVVWFTTGKDLQESRVE